MQVTRVQEIGAELKRLSDELEKIAPSTPESISERVQAILNDEDGVTEISNTMEAIARTQSSPEMLRYLVGFTTRIQNAFDQNPALDNDQMLAWASEELAALKKVQAAA